MGVGVALIGLIFAVFYPDTAYMPKGWNDKLFASFPALAGPVNHSNTLGLFLAFCAPFTLLISRKWWKWTSLLLIAGVIVLSQSRTAMLALGVSLAVFLICTLWPGTSKVAAGLSLFLAGALVVAIPLVNEDPHGFTDRGTVWKWTFEQFHSARDYVWGVSSTWPSHPNGWRHGALLASAHNLFIQWLFVGGVALVILGALLFLAYTRRVMPMLPGTTPLVAIMYMLTLLGVSVSEYIVELAPASPFFLVIVVPIVCVLVQPRPEARQTPERMTDHPLTSNTAIAVPAQGR